MFKVDIEGKMLKMNSKKVAEEELFMDSVKSFLKEEEANEEDMLEKIGLGHILSKKVRIENKRNDKHHFSDQKMFSEKQIERIAIKYGLRFLQTRHFNGNLTNGVLPKIKEFFDEHPQLMNDNNDISRNFYILAPKKSFSLQKKPKDPILFYKTFSNQYYLIYKWGNDISIFRSLKFFFLRTTWHAVLFSLILLAGTITATALLGPENYGWRALSIIGTILSGGLLGTIIGVCGYHEGPLPFATNKVWNSSYSYMK